MAKKAKAAGTAKAAVAPLTASEKVELEQMRETQSSRRGPYLDAGQLARMRQLEARDWAYKGTSA
ncbi:MAG TPA: hypothetical protein VMY87_06300 [Armatimonadota bacterium]|nr:hypothetical protein [Armatimonadota bacterium]